MDVYRCVLVFAHAERPELFPGIAAHLKRRHGTRAILIGTTRESCAHYERRFPGVFDEAISTRFFYDSLLEPEPPAKEVFEEARALERRFDFRLMQLVMDNRHLGIGFSPGGLRFPRSNFARAATYAKALRAHCQLLRTLEEVIERRKVSLVLNPTGAAAVVAAAKGIPVRTLMATRYRDYHYWAVDDVLTSNVLAGRWAVRRGGTGHDGTLEAGPGYYGAVRRQMLTAFRTRGMVRAIAREVARRAYHRLRGYDKAKEYPLSENILAHYRIWAQHRVLRRGRLFALDELDGADFVYFPLGVEPERSLTRDSPEFTDQRFAALALAKELPAGVVLAIKEHLPAIGPRPRDYYEGLRAMTNVILLDPLIPSINAIKRSRAVATVTGTAGLEAAILGKPVISFGKHNIYNIVPHVHTVASWLDIAGAVAAVLRDDDAAQEARERDGRVFLGSLVDISVDLAGVDFRSPPSEAAVDAILDLLERTFTRT
ncbi:MAG: hypothetical protein FJX56_02275 [Alphaproteobacteria bacterium]|nr:hypothetical protein [Alphaproteobacteria bacterium]